MTRHQHSQWSPSSRLLYTTLCLTHLRLVPHTVYASVNCISIGSDDCLAPIRYQAIISTSAGLLSIRPLGTNFSKILIKIQDFSFTEMHLNIVSVKWWPFCPGGDELRATIGQAIPFLPKYLISISRKRCLIVHYVFQHFTVPQIYYSIYATQWTLSMERYPLIPDNKKGIFPWN